MHTRSTSIRMRRLLPRVFLLLAMLALCVGALPALADGTVNGVIGAEYGSTRSIDADNDGWCQNTSARGDIIDFHAYNDSNNRWNFAFVLDSSQPLNDTGDTGFFGDTAKNRVDYFIPIDVGANSTPQLYFDNAPNWNRKFGVTGDYFIYCAPDLSCSLYNSSGSAVAGASISVSSQPVDFRRQVELRIDNDGGSGVNANSAIGAMVISSYNPGDNGFTGPYYSLDAAGDNSPEGMAGNSASDICGSEFNYRNYTDNNVVTTANCSGRQCTSLPLRTTVIPLTGATCTGEQGVDIDGDVFGNNEGYTFLSEASFAGPYQGGSTTTSDFIGESANTIFYTGANYSSRSRSDLSGVSADVAYVNARAGTCFFYLEVEGPTAVNAGGSDLADLFVAIDRNGGTGTVAAPYARQVEFEGWEPDYAVHLLWEGNSTGTTVGNLFWRAGATWNSSAFPRVVAPVNTGALYNAADCATLDAGDILYYGDVGATTGFEFAIPWTLLGGQPASTDQIRIGVYTTYNDIGYDVYDQAPGVGQGCSGLACQERIGDEPHDVDASDADANTGDDMPYSGRTIGDGGDAPASDPFSDIDTIEEYFIFEAGPNMSCPNALTLHTLSAGATIPAVLPLAGTAIAALGAAAYAWRRRV